jgi:hypothetical protein
MTNDKARITNNWKIFQFIWKIKQCEWINSPKNNFRLNKKNHKIRYITPTLCIEQFCDGREREVQASEGGLDLIFLGTCTLSVLLHVYQLNQFISSYNRIYCLAYFWFFTHSLRRNIVLYEQTSFLSKYQKVYFCFVHYGEKAHTQHTIIYLCLVFCLPQSNNHK